MKLCPYCGHSNLDNATQCHKCDGSFVPTASATVYRKTYWCGPEKAREVRRRALSAIVLGLLVLVYWGGYGPWPVIDTPTLERLRTFLQPVLLYGGILVYLAGWALNWI